VRYDTERASARTEHLEAIAQTLRQELGTLELLGNIGTEITAKLDPQSVFDTLNRHLGRLMDATHLSIFQMVDNPASLTKRFGIEHGKPLAHLVIPLDDPHSRIARCAREHIEIHQDEPTPDDLVVPFPGTEPFGSMVFLPLVANERLFGVLSVQAPAPHAYGQRELLILRSLCAYGAVALSNAIAVAELHQAQEQLVKAMGTLRQMATHDALTGATNRGGFYEQASQEIARSREFGLPLSVILFDLDHFKEINDTWGHAIGDEVLQAVVRIADAHSRARDPVARIGGEEFALLLPEVDIDMAATIANRLCSAMASTALPTKRGELHITASFSVASLAAEDAAIDDLLARADAALYAAKHAGRNRVLLAALPAAS
jgi:diguanylate cyclase (GGDEF)-like protein